MTEPCGAEPQRLSHKTDFTDGVLRITPIFVSVIPFGLLLGALAAQKGLSPLEVLIMSATVFAGSAQFVAVDLWREPLPVLTLVVTTLLVNLRHVLMGAAITPALTHWRRAQGYGALFFLADEIWALAMHRSARGRLTPAYYLGLALPLYVNWLTCTTLGAVIGGVLRDPARYGFDFAFTAIFLVLLSGLWRGRRAALPWAASGLAAVLAYKLLPGVWYILLGGLAGVLVGAWRGSDDDGA